MLLYSIISPFRCVDLFEPVIAIVRNCKSLYSLLYKKKSEVEKNRKISCVGKRIQEKVVIEAFLGEKKIKNSCFTSLPVKSKGNPVWIQHYLFVFFCGSLSNATF